MRTTPPDDFDLSRFLNGIYTYQNWEIFPGIKTAGSKDVGLFMEQLKIPTELSGLRILDIAPWNGFFSFECIRRGASEVVSLGPDDPDKTGYNRVKDLLNIENCRYVRASVYDLNLRDHGAFDIVLFLGLLYHLRHPLLALDKIFDISSKYLYVDTPIIDWKVYDKSINEKVHERIILDGIVIHNLMPMVYFTKGAETGDLYNWFIPNRHAFHDWVESAGFQIVHAGDDGTQWAWLAAEKTQRLFTSGIEGYNPNTENFKPNN